MASGTAGKIKDMGKAWGKARETTKADSGDFVNVGSGTYTMQIVKAEAGDFGDQRKLRMDWCVVKAADDEDVGSIQTDFEGFLDEERAVWMQRLLIKLGVDLDEVEIENEADLVKVWQELIDAKTCAIVMVVEKDGWFNLKVKKKVDGVDEDLLVDPEKALAARNAGNGKDEEEDEEGDELDVGDRVSFKHKGEAVEGVIEDWDDDDNALVKIDGKKGQVTVDPDKLTLVEEEDEEEPKKKKGAKEDEEEDEEEDEPKKKERPKSAKEDDDEELEKGSKVEVEIDGDWFPGVAQAGPKKDKISVKFDEDGEVEDHPVKNVRLVNEDDDEEEDEPKKGKGKDDDEEDGAEIEKGDRVVVDVRGKQKAGKVTAVDGDKVKVKLDANDKIIEVEASEVKFETE